MNGFCSMGRRNTVTGIFVQAKKEVKRMPKKYIHSQGPQFIGGA